MIGYLRNVTTFALAGMFAASCTVASAQTCVAPMPLQWDGDLPLPATTCDHEPDGLSLCGGSVLTTASAFVASLHVGEGATAVLDLDGFDSAIMLLVGPGCEDGPCWLGDAATPLSLADVPPDEYALVVTSNPSTAPDGTCGDFSLSHSGDFGVFDRIFADDFD